MAIRAAWNLARMIWWLLAGMAIRQFRSPLRTASLAAATSSGVGALKDGGYADGGGGTAGPLLGPAGTIHLVPRTAGRCLHSRWLQGRSCHLFRRLFLARFPGNGVAGRCRASRRGGHEEDGGRVRTAGVRDL